MAQATSPCRRTVFGMGLRLPVSIDTGNAKSLPDPTGLAGLLKLVRVIELRLKAVSRSSY